MVFVLIIAVGSTTASSGQRKRPMPLSKPKSLQDLEGETEEDELQESNGYEILSEKLPIFVQNNKRKRRG